MKKISIGAFILVSAFLCIFSGGCTKGTKNIPTVVTTPVTQITQTSANSGGNVTNDQGEYVTSRGICWSTSRNPSINSNITVNGQGMWEFSSKMTGLAPNTIYYVRAYAVIRDNPTACVGYGEILSFKTLP